MSSSLPLRLLWHLPLVLAASNARLAAAQQRFDAYSAFSPIALQSGKRLEVHPFGGAQSAFALSGELGADYTPASLAQYANGRLGFDQAVVKYLQDEGLSPLIAARPSKAGGHDWAFFVGNVRVCGFQIKATPLPGRTALISGAIPLVDATASLPEWPDLREAAQTGANALVAAGLAHGSAARVLSAERCARVVDGTLQPAWDMALSINGLSFHAIAGDTQPYAIERSYFDAARAASISAYDRNPNDHTPIDFKVDDLTGDGTLATAKFRTDVGSAARAMSTTGQFNYAPTDPRFAEASVFAHAHRMLAWFEGLGYHWEGGPPLMLELHKVIGGSVNQAAFFPAEYNDSGSDEIMIGDGDGKVLRSLPLDADVVSHELSHHVIWQTLKSASGESLVIHEGLADYFALARAGDSCLGASLCVSGQPAYPAGMCWVQDRCLRTADNDLTLETPNLPKEAHVRGQVLSGMLWDLAVKQGVGLSQTTQLVFDSLSYLLEASGYRDMVLALLAADRAHFGGQYACRIVAAAISRGFGPYISDVQCQNPTVPALGGTSLTDDPQPPAPKSPSHGLCGTIAGQNGSSPWVFWLFLLLPVFFVTRGEKRPRMKLMGLFLLGCIGTERARASEIKQIQVNISAIWEGGSITAYDLAAIKAFRSRFPDLTIGHFVSAAYFARSESKAITQALHETMRLGDFVGIDLVPWKSVVTSTGAIFHRDPTFWGDALSQTECAKDCGREVPINIYPEGALKKMLAFSSKSLEQAGFTKPTAFMAAGWLASPNVLAAAADNGISYDFSAVPPDLLAPRLTFYPLFAWIKTLWPKTTPTTVPYQVDTAEGRITEVPQAWAAIDYVPLEALKTLVNQAVSRAATGQESYVSIAFHEETAAEFLPVLSAGIDELRAQAAKNGVSLKALDLRKLELSTAQTLNPVISPAAVAGAVAPSSAPTATPNADPFDTPLWEQPPTMAH